MLRPCSDLLKEFIKSGHKGREINIQPAMEMICYFTETMGAVSKPTGLTNEGHTKLLAKVKAPREFDGSVDLVSLVTGQDYKSAFQLKPSVKEEWPTALENLYAIMYFLLQMAKELKTSNQPYDVK